MLLLGSKHVAYQLDHREGTELAPGPSHSAGTIWNAPAKESPMAPTVLLVVTALMAQGQVSQGQVSQGQKPEVLDCLVQSALGGHPTLGQIEARVQEANARARQRKAFPDPRLGVALEAMPLWPPRFDSTPMTGLQFSLSQAIPWPTRLTLAARVEERRADVARAQLEEARLQLAASIRAVGLELAYLDAERSITVQRGKVIERLVALVTTKYRVNKANLESLLKGKLARSQIEDRLLEIAQSRDGVEARLNALAGRRAGVQAPSVALPTAWPRLPSLDALLERAQRQRPLLAVQRLQVAVHRARRAHARTGYYPDFAVTLGYRYRQDSGMDPVNGMDFWSVGVSVRIPIWSVSGTRAEVREAEAAITGEEHRYQDALLNVSQEVRTARDGVLRLDARLRLLRERILPEARQALQAAIQAYTTGRADFLTLLEHERALFDLESRVWKMHTLLAVQWIRLHGAIGEPGLLPALPRCTTRQRKPATERRVPQ